MSSSLTTRLEMAFAHFDGRCFFCAAVLAESIYMCCLGYELPMALGAQTSGVACVVALAAGGLLAACAVVARVGGGRWARPRTRVVAALVCLIAAHGGFAVVLAFGLADAAGVALAAACYFLLGVSVVLTCVVWMGVLCRDASFSLFLHASLVLLASSLLVWVYEALPGALLTDAVMAVCSIVGLAVALRLSAGEEAAESVGMSGGAGGAAADLAFPALVKTLSTYRAAVPSLAGLWLCAFNAGAIALPSTQLYAQRLPLVHVVGNVIIVAVAAPLVLALCDKVFTSADAARRLSPFAPVCIAFIGVYAFVRMLDAVDPFKFMLSLLFRIACPGLACCFVTFVAMRCKEERVAPDRIVALAILSCFVFFVFGFAAMEALGNTALYIQVALALVFVMLLAVVDPKDGEAEPSVAGSVEEGGPARPQGATEGAKVSDAVSAGDVAEASPVAGAASVDLEGSCARLAQAGGLSAREAEIMALLVQGKSAQDVADELVISPQTVNTHRKHIYAKLGVHKYQELLALVYGEAGAPANFTYEQ